MIRRIISAFLILALCIFPAISVCAASDQNVYDDADLLNRTEELRLSEKLQEISRQYNAQIVVMTVSSTYVNTDIFAENIYDSMDIGYGDARDGVLLLVCMDVREYRILSNGFAGAAIAPGDIDSIGDAIVSDLSAGSYATAFDEFADQCAYYLDGYINGFPFNFRTNLTICLILGVVIGVIVAFVLKGQLKTVRKQNQANAYVQSGSMHVTVRSDLFLYRNISRTRKASSNSSGSRSSRNIGGGRF